MSNKSNVCSILVALLANAGRGTKKSSVRSHEMFEETADSEMTASAYPRDNDLSLR